MIAIAVLLTLALGSQDLAPCPPAGWTPDRLRSLKQQKFAVADPGALRRLAIDLAGCLGDPNPELRDGIAFEALATWMRGDALDVVTRTALRERLLLMMNEPDPNGFRRPFTALVLAEVARTDRIKQWMPAEDRERVVAAAAGFLSGVKDYRGFTDGEGWRHGVAHGADLVLQLALNAQTGKAQLDRLLEAIAMQVAPATVSYHFGEPDRLARPVLFIAQRDLHSDAEWAAWFARVMRPDPLPSWEAALSSEAGLAKRHNARQFLLSVYAAASEATSAGVRRLIDPARQGLKQLP